MNLSQSLSLTPKGEDELKNRVYKLNMKKRNVLILVQQPRTIQYVIDRAVFDAKELLEEIVSLVKEGFLKLGDASVAAGVAVASMKSAGKSKEVPKAFDGNITIHEDIVLSESKFLMVDYCVEVFKTGATPYIAKITACKTVEGFTECIREICQVTKASHPESLETFSAVLKEINQTAI